MAEGLFNTLRRALKRASDEIARGRQQRLERSRRAHKETLERTRQEDIEIRERIDGWLSVVTDPNYKSELGEDEYGTYWYNSFFPKDVLDTLAKRAGIREKIVPGNRDLYDIGSHTSPSFYIEMLPIVKTLLNEFPLYTEFVAEKAQEREVISIGYHSEVTQTSLGSALSPRTQKRLRHGLTIKQRRAKPRR